MDINTAQHEERIRYRDQIAEVTQNLDTLKKANDNSSKQIKEVVKPVARKYTEMASIHIPKVWTPHEQDIYFLGKNCML